MNVKPVKRYKGPGYPDKQEVIANPELLKLMPERWKGNVYARTALSTLLILSLTSCKQREVSGGNQPETIALVAPVFDHGDGRGSFGCMSIAPPSFLSEEEAFQVIQEEANKHGISFEKESLEIENAKIPETKYYLKPEEPVQDYKENGGVINSTKRGNLKLDGYDDTKKIGYEFISKEDYDSWSVEQGVRSSVDDFDFLSTAKLLGEGLENRNGETSIGIFYNPMSGLTQDELKLAGENRDWDAMEAKIRQRAEENLREQVKDFLEWLKAQGIM